VIASQWSCRPDRRIPGPFAYTPLDWTGRSSAPVTGFPRMVSALERRSRWAARADSRLNYVDIPPFRRRMIIVARRLWVEGGGAVAKRLPRVIDAEIYRRRVRQSYFARLVRAWAEGV